MRQFLKFILATLVGLFLFCFLGFLFIMGIAASASKDSKPELEANSVLKLDLNYQIPEQSVANPFAAFDFNTMKTRKATGVQDVIEAIRAAAKDDKIKGIYLPMGVNTNGMATLEALRNALLDFKKSGKFIYAYGETVSQRSYYLASVADKIILNPSGGMELTGFGREIMYYKNMLEKIGVEVQDFHCGAFKSAIEPYLRDKMSDANREQLTAVYSDLYAGFLKNIATSRKIDEGTLNDAINNLQAVMPEDAMNLKLADQLGYYDEIESAIKDKVGLKKSDELKMVDQAKYVTTLDKETDAASKIAVIYADGEIVDGDGQEGEIGGQEFAKIIRKARQDEKVKAIVLRVNSPGGSALASDIMWRELKLAKKDKPLVISMGDLAASGGYFIACMGDRIFAQPNTITGSIGVFGLIPNAKKLLNEKLGITTDQVEVTKHGSIGLVTNPLDEEEKAMIQRSVEKTYREFKSRVAEGRKKDTAYIETIAQGHVWTGNQGMKNGLVDEIGSLDDAIRFAAKQANLKEYKLKAYPEEKSLGEQIAESFADTKAKWMREEMGEQQYNMYQTLKRLEHFKGVQMRAPMELY
ncbi:MAG: signal peptide peptidase SppA [Chitinophagales bacterium]